MITKIPPQELKLEVGKTYINRRGELVFIRSKHTPLKVEYDSGPHASRFHSWAPYGATYIPHEPRAVSGSSFAYRGISDTGVVDYLSNGKRGSRDTGSDIFCESTEDYHEKLEARLRMRIEKLARENAELKEQIEGLAFLLNDDTSEVGYQEFDI
jgi:hypothetical protein